MKIGMFLTSYFPDQCGGAEQQCRRLSEELVRRGHGVTILTSRARKDVPFRSVENGVVVLRLARLEALFGKARTPVSAESPARMNVSPVCAPPRFAWLRKRAADVLYIANVWSFFWGSAWAMWRLRCDIDVWHAHVATLASGWCSFWAERYRIPALCKGANLPVFSPEPGMPMKRLLRRARHKMHFIALTPEMKADLVSRNVPPERVVVIPNGIPLPADGPRPDPGEKGVVLYVGNLTQPVANKAVDILFDAWAKVHEARPGARLVVAGDGDSRRWREFLRQRNAEDSAEFMGRVEDLAPLYCKAAMLVLPSRHEGVSNALLEAQSWGIPAVVSNIPGNVLVVDHGKNGLVVPIGDSEALTRGIIQLLDDADLRTRLGCAARIRIATDFQMDQIAMRIDALYNSILEVQA